MTKRSLTLNETVKQEPSVSPPQAKQIVKYAQESKSLVVGSQATRTTAIELLREVKSLRASVVDFFKDMKQTAHNAWKAIVAKESEYTRALDEVEANVKRSVLAYDQGEEKKRLAEERRLQAEAEAAAEAERQRLFREAQRSKKPEVRAAKLAEARAVEAEVVEVAPTLEKEQGESTREVWKARVVNEKLVPRQYLMVNERLLAMIARESKGQLPTAIPGVEFYSEQSLAVGRGT